MVTRRARSCLVVPALLAALTGCPPLPGEVITCEEADDCPEPGSTSSGDDATPTSGSIQTVTGDEDTVASSTTMPDEETGTTDTTSEPAAPPLIIDRVVIPDFIDDNGALVVEASTTNAEGVHLLLDTGEQIELTQTRPGEFRGEILALAYTDNGKHTAVLTPWRDQLVGESVGVDYVIALPKHGDGTGWDVDGVNGSVAAIAVLPDGRPVELGGAGVDVHPHRPAGPPARARGGGRPVWRGLCRGHLRRRPPGVRAHRQLTRGLRRAAA